MPKGTSKKHRALSSKQLRAADLIACGFTHEDAANEVGVDRVTVTNWINHNPVFAAEVNRLIEGLRESVRSRLLSVANASLDQLESDLEQGKTDVALSVIRSVGPTVLRSPVGLLDPDEIRSQKIGKRANQRRIAEGLADPEIHGEIDQETKELGSDTD